MEFFCKGFHPAQAVAYQDGRSATAQQHSEGHCTVLFLLWRGLGSFREQALVLMPAVCLSVQPCARGTSPARRTRYASGPASAAAAMATLVPTATPVSTGGCLCVLRGFTGVDLAHAGVTFQSRSSGMEL